jgi:NAD(P)-dependent dehydrogenase (short-subunit alcohol dehydrogenase family)
LVAANKAADEIKQRAGGQGYSKVVVRHLDLASLTSVGRFVKDIKNSETRLDILINNAGM